MKSSIPLLGAAAVLAIAADTRAGYEDNLNNCYKNTDGSGWCYGSMRGFRTSADASAYAAFTSTATTFSSTHFVASFNSDFYTCVPSSGSPIESLWPLAHNSDLYFTIGWDSNGTCTYLYVASGSANYY